MKINPGFHIRLATADDLPAINDIYNHYVLNSVCTYQEIPEKIEDRRKWFADHGPRHPVTVATLENRVVAWGALGQFRTRSAYRFTVENAVYVHHEFHRQGLGHTIMIDLIERAKIAGHHTIIAGVDGEQAGSLTLHEKLGFKKVAEFKQVGWKFDRWLDVIFLQLMV